MPDDFSADTNTSGSATVGGTASGDIESSGDRDWFEVDLVAGRTYTIELRGSPTADGTLSDPYLRGIHDADGNLMARTTNDDGGDGRNSRVTFTATASGTYYIAAGAFGGRQGTYKVEVTDNSPATVDSEPPATDDTRAGATDLGDITALEGPRFPRGTLDGDGDRIDYYRFTLTEAKRVGLGLRQQDADADLFLEDADGNVQHSSTASGTSNEAIPATLLAGTYYVRVESREAGVNRHVFRYGVSAPDPDALAALEAAAAESADGGTDRVSLGTVVATDPEATPQTVSEAEDEDFSGHTSTSGRVAVGETATGEIGSSGDRDWFAVELVAGRSYTINLRGSPTRDGTLSDPYLRGIHDADGNLIAGTTNDDGGFLYNSRVTFTASESGTHYIAAGAFRNRRGTYEVEVTDNSPSFAEEGYTFDLAENADGSTERVSLGTVTATDPEGATLAYNLVGDSGAFEIDAASGELFYTGSGEDFESGTTRFTLTVRASDGSETTDTTVTVNVTDVEEAPVIQVADAEATEGDDSAIVFRVTLESASSGTGTVNYATADGTATAGEDYTATSGTLTFAPGETEQTVAVAMIDDEVEDSGETFTLVLSDPSGGQLGDTEATGTIFNTDPPLTRTSVSEPAGEDLPANTTTMGVVAVGGTATGRVGTQGDRDWFAVTLEANKSYRIDLKGASTSDGTMGDPQIHGIRDPAGNYIRGTGNDDGEGGWLVVNSRDFFTPRTAGTYYIEAGGNDDEHIGTYTLSVTSLEDDYAATRETKGSVAVGGTATGEIEMPGDRDWFKVELEAGHRYQIVVTGVTLSHTYLDGFYDASGTYIRNTTRVGGAPNWDSRITFDADDAGAHYLAVRSPPHRSGTYEVSVTDITDVTDDYSAGTGTLGAVTLAADPDSGSVTGSVTATIDPWNDRDWFKVILEAGKTYRFDMKGADSNSGTLEEPYLRGIYDAAGNLIAGTSREPVYLHTHGRMFEDNQVIHTAGSSGAYYVAADGYSWHTGTYRLEVTDVSADYPEEIESELGTTGTIAVGDSVQSQVDFAFDRDWFAVTLKAGQTYRFDITDRQNGGGTLLDPYLYGIRDAAGNLIDNTSDDGSGPWWSSREWFTPEANGTYYVSAGSAITRQYPTARLTTHTGTYTLSVTEINDDFSADARTMGRVAVGGVAMGEIEIPTDRDWFAVALEEGKTYRFDMKGARSDSGTLWNTYLSGLHDAAGNLIEGTSDNYDYRRDQDIPMTFTAESTATYYVSAATYTWDSGTYALSVTEVSDAM